MTQAGITASCREMISTVVIDNPPHNYLDDDLLAALHRTVSEVHGENPDLRVVLIASKGKNFSAGIDYARLKQLTQAEAKHLATVGHSLLNHLEALPVPVIAAVKGETTGAGLGLALAADIRVASADAVFSLPETRLGLPPSFGSSQRLYKTVGVGRAKELLFTGRTVDAEEALRSGLVNRVVSPDMLDREAERLAVSIAGNSLSSLRAAKMLIHFGLNEGYETGLKEEITAFSEAFNPDTKQWERL